jgi:hypothetical protein|tara:strand:- start:954 stop:1118 length:165 start_codon:yes stop_codon:yes gene_type:complete
MAEVAIEMSDVQQLMDSNPTFRTELTAVAFNRRIDELEAEKAAAPVCDCQKDEE